MAKLPNLFDKTQETPLDDWGDCDTFTSDDDFISDSDLMREHSDPQDVIDNYQDENQEHRTY